MPSFPARFSRLAGIFAAAAFALSGCNSYVSCTIDGKEGAFRRDLKGKGTVILGADAKIVETPGGGANLVITNAVRDEGTGEVIRLPANASDCTLSL